MQPPKNLRELLSELSVMLMNVILTGLHEIKCVKMLRVSGASFQQDVIW